MVSRTLVGALLVGIATILSSCNDSASTGPGQSADLVPLALVPALWGAITGLGLTAWAYESLRVRRIGDPS